MGRKHENKTGLLAVLLFLLYHQYHIAIKPVLVRAVAGTGRVVQLILTCATCTTIDGGD